MIPGQIERIVAKKLIVYSSWQEPKFLGAGTGIVCMVLWIPILEVVRLGDGHNGIRLLGELPKFGIICLELDASQNISSNTHFLKKVGSIWEFVGIRVDIFDKRYWLFGLLQLREHITEFEVWVVVVGG